MVDQRPIPAVKTHDAMPASLDTLTAAIEARGWEWSITVGLAFSSDQLLAEATIWVRGWSFRTDHQPTALAALSAVYREACAATEGER